MGGQHRHSNRAMFGKGNICIEVVGTWPLSTMGTTPLHAWATHTGESGLGP